MNLLNCVLPAKNIMVYDIAAESSGALSILRDFYDEVKNHEDKSIKWFFVLSTPDFEETDNIKIIRYPWIKKSWFHRLYFDKYVARGLVYKFGIEKIINFQNVMIPVKGIEQVVYIHQSLPFAEYKFGITENFLFWVYQNIIGRLIIRSIKNADKIIVQTQWMKRVCADKSGVDQEKFNVIAPDIKIKPIGHFNLNIESMSTFFYPATAVSYKNHRLIMEACKLLIKERVVNFKVIFTFDGDESNEIRYLFDEARKHNLPIDFVGHLKREKVFEWYIKSVLIFPSYIESFPLPLREAQIHGSPILVSDCPFSHEILDGYGKVSFFHYDKANELASLMLKQINKRK